MKNKTLTKEYIFKLFLNVQNLMSFLPDNPDIRGLSREFLLSVLFYESLKVEQMQNEMIEPIQNSRN